MSLQTTAENRQWLCRRDVMWQTVPDSRGGNRESSVAVRRQPRTAHNQRRWRGRTQTMSSRGRRRGTTALHPADTCRREGFVHCMKRCRIEDSTLEDHIPPLPSPPFPLSLSLPFVPLEVAHPWLWLGACGALKLPQRVWAGPGRQTYFGEF